MAKSTGCSTVTPPPTWPRLAPFPPAAAPSTASPFPIHRDRPSFHGIIFSHTRQGAHYIAEVLRAASKRADKPNNGNGSSSRGTAGSGGSSGDDPMEEEEEEGGEVRIGVEGGGDGGGNRAMGPSTPPATRQQQQQQQGGPPPPLGFIQGVYVFVGHGRT